MTLRFNESSALPLINPDNLKWQFQKFRSTTLTTLANNTGRTFSTDRQSLVINSVRLTDEGRYTLTANNAAGLSKDFINLTVFGNRQRACIFTLHFTH